MEGPKILSLESIQIISACENNPKNFWPYIARGILNEITWDKYAEISEPLFQQVIKLYEEVANAAKWDTNPVINSVEELTLLLRMIEAFDADEG